MSDFNPFNKTINEVEVTDLLFLKEVAEGWYLDYKQNLISVKDLAKHLSSFANSYGGWLIFGVKEKSKDQPVAGEFLGISKKDSDKLLQALRSAADQHCNPTPFFETRIVNGPYKDIGLDDDKMVVIVEISKGNNPPYIHSSGRVYRRINDGSEPFSEIKDRHELDTLYKRSEKLQLALEEFLDRDPVVSGGIEDFPHIRLMILASLDGNHEQEKWLSFEEFTEIVANPKSDAPTISMTMDNTISSADHGYVARHIFQNDPCLPTTSMCFRTGLTFDIFLPLQTNYYTKSDGFYFDDKHNFLNEMLTNLLSKHNYQDIKVVKISPLIQTVACMIGHIKALSEASGYTGSYRYKFQILNAQNIVPYIDIPEYMANLEKFGAPLQQRNNSTFPWGKGIDDFEIIGRDSDDFYFSLQLSIIVNLLLAFGFPQSVLKSGPYTKLAKHFFQEIESGVHQ